MKQILVGLPRFITQSIDWYDGLRRSVMNPFKTSWKILLRRLLVNFKLFLKFLTNFFPRQRILFISSYSMRSISGNLDKWNFHKVEPFLLVPRICFIKSPLFQSDNWNPRLVELSINETIFLVQQATLSRISGTFVKDHLKNVQIILLTLNVPIPDKVNKLS